MVGTDLDGTLLNRQNQISTINRQAIQGLAQQQVVFAITSGRKADSIQAVFKDLNVSGYKVCLNGSYVLGPADEVLYEAPLSIATIRQIFRIGLQNQVQVFFNSAAVSFYYQPTTSQIAIPEFVRGNPSIVQIQSEQALLATIEKQGLNIYKAAFTTTDTEALTTCLKTLEQQQIVNQVWSDRNYLEMTAKGVTKLTGIKKIAEYLALDLTEIACFGDYDNDIEMLAGVGYGVAMSNAVQKVKQASYLIIDNQHAEGVGNGIKQLMGEQNGA